MNVKSFEELGAWFTTEHAWAAPDSVVSASALFLAAEYQNIPWPVVFVDNQPYESSKAMRARVLESGILYISREGNSGPLSEIALPNGIDANLTFRAVHDQHHVLIQAPFNFSGEARASAHMLRLIDEHGIAQGWDDRLIADVKAFHFSEMMGQVSYYYNNGRQYLDTQYVVRYDDVDVTAFQAEWTREYTL